MSENDNSKNENLVLVNESKVKFSNSVDHLKKLMDDNKSIATIDTVAVNGGLFNLGNHKVTGQELNAIVQEIQNNFKNLNTKENKTLKELQGVYYSLEILNKEYLDRILQSFIQAQNAADKASEAEEKNKETIEALQKLVNNINQFNMKVSYELSRIDSENWKENALKHKEQLDHIDEKTEEISNIIASYKSQHQELLDELRNYESQRDKMLKEIDTLKERYEKLDIQKKDTENQIALEESRMIKVNKADVKEIISSISNYDIQNKEGKGNLITQFVDSVYVFPDGKITIFFCFKGYKHVKFEDLKDKFSREPVKGKFYIEQVYNESSYGITIKDSSFRFADSSRKRQKSIYHNATTQYYKFPDTVFDSLDGLEPVTAIKDQMSKKPRIFKRPFTIEEIAN